MFLSLSLTLLTTTALPLEKDIGTFLRKPDKVESFEVESDGFSKFAILPKSQPVSAPVASELAKIFLDPATFDDYIKGCGFSPAVAFRFTKGDKAIDVLVSFQCRELQIQPAGSNDWRVGKKSFDRLAPRILALTKTARPDDVRLKDFK